MFLVSNFVYFVLSNICIQICLKQVNMKKLNKQRTENMSSKEYVPTRKKAVK